MDRLNVTDSSEKSNDRLNHVLGSMTYTCFTGKT